MSEGRISDEDFIKLFQLPPDILKRSEWERFEYYMRQQGGAKRDREGVMGTWGKKGLEAVDFPDYSSNPAAGMRKGALVAALGLPFEQHISNPNKHYVAGLVERIVKTIKPATRSEESRYHILTLPERKVEPHDDRPSFWKMMNEVDPKAGDFVAYILEGGVIYESNAVGGYVYRGWKWPNLPPHVKRAVMPSLKPFIDDNAVLCIEGCGRAVGQGSYNSRLYATKQCGQNYRKQKSRTGVVRKA